MLNNMKTTIPSKIGIALVAAILPLLGAGCGKTPETKINPNVKINVTSEMAKNLSYPIDGFAGIDSAQLANGIAKFTDPENSDNGSAKLGDAIGYGDLDGDGYDEAVVALYVNTGGSGVWPLIYVLQGDDGKAVASRTFLPNVADRDLVDKIDITNGIVAFGLTVHGPNDPACCATVKKTELFRLVGSQLVPAK
jgi:hypothetical protein